MAIVDVKGGLDRLLQLAGPQQFNDTNWNDPLFVTVQGCAGPDPGDWLYDASAEDVVVLVEPAEEADTFHVELVSLLPSASEGSASAPAMNTVRGSFDVTSR